MNVISQFDLCTSSQATVAVKSFALTPYSIAYQAMVDYSNARDASSPDQIWLIQHPRVYTQGTSCQQSTLMPSDIPVVKTDRGGQITYHGPGQVVLYPLLNLRRFELGVKALVATLEQSVIAVLDQYGVSAHRREDAPGVYVANAKIAALGLRIRRGNSYHGLSLNVDMDLAPFTNIDPCGYQGLEVTQLSSLIKVAELNTDLVGERLARQFVSLL